MRRLALAATVAAAAAVGAAGLAVGGAAAASNVSHLAIFENPFVVSSVGSTIFEDPFGFAIAAALRGGQALENALGAQFIDNPRFAIGMVFDNPFGSR